jgi:16S rRNA processing protein RimM
MSSQARWVALAEVTRPHGVRGEVRLRLYNSDSELLPSQSEVLLRPASGGEKPVRVESMRGADAGHLIAKFRGIDDRDQADLLRRAEVCVPREAFPPLDEGEFYVCDVIGARVVGPGGELGQVQDLVNYPSADAFVVKIALADVGTVELPLLDDFIEQVDAEHGEVRVKSAAVDFLLQRPS